MRVRIRHKKGKQSEAYARFHRVVCDQPFDDGGEDGGMTPPELMLSALGCCAMHYAAEYLRTRGFGTENVEIRVSAEKGGQPVRLLEIGIEVEAPGLDLRARQGLLKSVEACLLHRTLTAPPRVKVSLTPVTEERPLSSATAR
jgi:uncharacterized OsmC-like protein